MVIELYKQNMLNKNLAESTMRLYEKELNYFASYLETLKITNIEDVKGIHLDMFIATLIRNGNKPNTRSRKKSIIQKFFEYCVRFEIVDKNPTNALDSIKVTDADRKKKDVLTAKEKEKIFSKIEKNSRDSLKLRCLFKVLSQCAIRVSELCNLKWEDIDYKNKSITIYGKGRKMRKVPLFKDLEEDLKLLKKEQSKTCEYVFTVKNSEKPMQPRGVHDLVKRYTKNAKISKNIGPHALRRTAATDYLREGVNIKYIQMLLGHSSIATTMLYTTPGEEEMNEALQEAAKSMKKKRKRK